MALITVLFNLSDRDKWHTAMMLMNIEYAKLQIRWIYRGRFTFIHYDLWIEL